MSSRGANVPEDRALVASIEARDPDALARLFDRHAPRLLGLAHRILGESGEAEEVVQEVFLYVWRAASTFDPVRGSVLAWLLVATRSRSIDRLRARRGDTVSDPTGKSDPIAELPSGEDVEAVSASREWEERCRAAIAELPEEQRQVLEMSYFEGRTHREIADRTGSPLGTVKTRIRLGLMKLRERLGPYWSRGRNA